MVKNAKDGRFYAPIEFINAVQGEQIGRGGGAEKLLDTRVEDDS